MRSNATAAGWFWKTLRRSPGLLYKDTGEGFNDENFDSFNTSYSDYKISQGGTGLGRFIWLKAFERVEIESVFRESHTPAALYRKFVFDENYDADDAPATLAPHTNVGTSVRLTGSKEPYKTECPKTADQIAQRLIEHFVLIFLQSDCPIVELRDETMRLSLNQIFGTGFRLASAHDFAIKGVDFNIHGFRITAPLVARHRLIYAANSRGVVTDSLEGFIPNLSGRLTDSAGKSFVYLGIVQSPYLTQRVNNARTDFDLEHDDAEADQPTLLEEEIRRSDIREACLKHIQEDLSDIITGRNYASASWDELDS